MEHKKHFIIKHALTDKRSFKRQIFIRKKVYPFIWSVFRYVFIIGMAYVLLFPVLFMVSRAFRPAEDILNPSVIWIPSKITFENIKNAMKILDYTKTLLFTGRVVLLSTLFTLISCSFAGYALARYNLKATPFLVALAAFTIVVPMQTYIIPFFFQFRFFNFFGIGSAAGLFAGKSLTVNLTDSEMPYLITTILGMGLRSGLFILVFMQFFKGLPKELESAARIDGCGELRTYVKVMLPNSLPVFLVVFLFSLIWYWNDYFFAEIMLRQKHMLSNKIGMLRTLVNLATNAGSYCDGFSDTVLIHAGALLFIIPPMLVYLVAQKYFVQGIERTGIVG